MGQLPHARVEVAGADAVRQVMRDVLEDQSTASKADHPTCQYCARPLPCEPVDEDY